MLSGAGLPTIDLTPDSLSDFLVAADAGEVVGVVAVERCDGHGLLRSLVVDPAWRGTGLGRALVAAAEEAAARRELHSLTLLTQTAATFFRALGYHDIARTDAPAACSGHDRIHPPLPRQQHLPDETPGRPAP